MTNERRNTIRKFADGASNTLNALALASALGLVGFADFFNDSPVQHQKPSAKIEQQISPSTEPLHFESGTKVNIKEVLDQKLPTEYLENIKKSMKGKTGIVVSKSYHLFFLFDNGKFIQTGVVGTAKPGSRTPIGEYEVEKKIEGTHISTENDEPMENSVYYNITTGHAIHGSIHIKDGYVEWDSSHGCVNVSHEDSKMIFKILQVSKKGKRVLVKIIN